MGGQVISSDGGFNDDQWHYVVGTWNGSIVSIYVDGMFQGNADAINSSRLFRIVN